MTTEYDYERECNEIDEDNAKKSKRLLRNKARKLFDKQDKIIDDEILRKKFKDSFNKYVGGETMTTPNNSNKIVLNKNNIIGLLKEIKKYGFNYHCDCPTCIKIRDDINKVLREKQ